MNSLSEGAFQTIKKVQPSLLIVIGDLLNLKQSPIQIANRVARRDAALAGLVEMAADYMKETGLRPISKFCKTCGASMIPNSNFCSLCGN